MRTLHPFPGGVHPAEHKAESSGRPIAAMPLLPRYVVPLSQHIGTPAKPVVKPGDHVLRGQLIGQPVGQVSVGVHAPTSGTVRAIGMFPVPHPSGLPGLCIEIESDGEDRSIAMQPIEWHNLDPDVLRERVRDMGLAGLGGAVFPSHIKLQRQGHGLIPTLILNGAECEPWITSDDRLMRERACEILHGATIMQRILGAEEILVGIEDNKPEAIAAMRQAAGECGGHIEVVVVPTRYPSGGAKQLTYLLTGREVPSKKYTLDIGVQVFNVGTAYALYRAIVYGEPLISRVVTVTGHVARPGNFETRLGTPISDLIAAAGGELPAATGHIIGGPMMGYALHDTAAPVTKAVNCVIVKDAQTFPPPPPPRPCIRCGECARACPVTLQPFQLYWYARAKDFGKTQAHNLFDCIECGCCSYVCPSHIPLVDYFRFAKSEIWAREREKEAADAARARHEFHLARLEREKREKAEKLAKKAVERLNETEAASPPDPEAERKKAILQAAIERARLAKEGIAPKNTDNLPPAVQREIAAIDARRAARQSAAAETSAEAKPEQGSS